MLGFFKKNSNLIFSPVEGRCVPLEKVPDEAFANKALGNGVAFEFDGDEIFSPCDGKVTTIAKTKHAIGIKSKHGIEMLLHVGLDTVALRGNGFELFVQENQKIKKGDKLMKLNRSLMIEKGINLITPLIILNKTVDETDNSLMKEGIVNLNSIIFEEK